MGPHSVASYDTQGDAEDLFLLGSSQAGNQKQILSVGHTKMHTVADIA
jgi:hypothetical protein